MNNRFAGILLLWILLPGFFACQWRGKPNSSSAIDTARMGSIVKGYYELLNNLYLNDQIAEAQLHLDTLEGLYAEFPDKRFLYYLYSLKAQHFKHTSLLDSALRYYRLAEEIVVSDAGSMKNPEVHANSIKLSIAGILSDQNKFNEAYALLKEVYDYEKVAKDNILGMVTYQLGVISKQMGNTDLEKKYFLEAFTYDVDPYLKVGIAIGIRDHYADANNLDSADYYFNTYIAPDTILSSPKWQASKEEYRGWVLEKKGDIQGALRQYRKSLAISSSTYGLGLAQTYYNVAELLDSLGDYGNAIHYADSAIIAANKEDSTNFTTNINLQSDALHLKATSQLKAGDYRQAARNAIDAMEGHKKYADSSYATKAKELEEQYAAKEKDQQIETLAREKTASLRINKQQRIITLGSVGVLLLSVAVGVSFYRRNKMAGKLAQIDLEQRLLRSQMEPHFLYNTLGVLQRFIRSDQKEKSLAYLSSFANLLRANLENSRNTYVPLVDELKGVESYLSLQAMHSESNFDYSIGIANSEELEELSIFPMIIQPFVENAVQHGLKNIDYRGKIMVKIAKTADYLECTIDDNGVGLQRHPIGKSSGTAGKPSKISLAIQITQERLALLGKKARRNYSIVIRDKRNDGLGSGTLATIRIPYVMG